MAFNGYKLNYPTQRVVVNNDNEEVRSILSDDQSSWVLFNPDSDILSNTTQERDELTEPDFEEEEEEEDLEASKLSHDQPQQPQQLEEQGHEDEDTDTDSLIDNFDPSQLRLEKLFNKPHSRITNWNNVEDEIVDDNVASWDLDENLSNHSLDTSILKIKEFYGDELLRGMNKSELRQFKKIHHDLRAYLNRKPNPIINQMLLKLYPSKDYRNYNSHSYELPYKRYLDTNLTNHYDNDDVTSETASSSLVMCGANNWNDI